MIKISEQYLTNSKGKQVGVVLPLRAFRKLMALAEELDAIRAYDAAKSSKEKAIPLQQLLRSIESQRK